jgi:hypothetical protein
VLEAETNDVMTSGVTTRRPQTRSSWWARARPAVVAAAIMAAHAGCNGWVMARAWSHGGDIGRPNLAVVIASAGVVLLVAATAAVTAGAAMGYVPADGWRGLLPARPRYVAFGAAVALLLPPVWGLTREDVLIAGMYSLPWGAGLAAAGWLRGRAAGAVGVTVVVSAVLCAVFVGGTYLLIHHPTVGD